jgi:general secretion pathway protein K
VRVPRTTAPPDRQAGFALVAVMLVMALLGVIGAEFAFSMRLEASMVGSYKEAVLATHLAEAGIERAIREVLNEAPLVGHPEDGPLAFFRSPTQPIAPWPREAVPLGVGDFTYRITDEESRIDLNQAPPDRIDRLLAALGIEKRVRDTIVDSIQDWRDSNEEHRLNGAESEDSYLTLPVPYRARNANFEDLRELLQVKGVTAAIYYGDDERPPLRDFVTVRGAATVNINTAPDLVLRALGLADAEVTDILQARRAVPYASVPGRFTGRGLNYTTRSFRIEAEGRVGGTPRARVMAIVQRRADAVDQPEWSVVAWDADPDDRPESAEP